MNRNLPLTALAAAALLCASAAHAQSSPEFKFSGYGTLGVVHSSDDRADYKSDLFQPKGAGRSESVSFNPDTKLGLQGSVKFNDQFSAVVQVVSKYQYDNSYTPQVEWANVKYQPTSSLAIRLGRIAAPSYLLSESRFVGYASPWVRPPVEVYGVLAITSNDGADVSYRSRIGGVNNTVQVFAGSSKAKLNSIEAKAKLSWGINDTVEFGDFQFRAGYNALTLDLTVPALNAAFAGLQQFAAGANAVPVPAFQAAGAQALALIEKLKRNDMKVSAVALGVNYDPGNWFLMGEVVDFKGAGFLSDSRSWYVTAGVRLGAFTPYASYQTTKARIEPVSISTTGADPLAAGAAGLSAGINGSLFAFTPTQDSTTLGLRWDFAKNLAAKLQYDRFNVGARSNGRFAVPTGTSIGDSSIDTVSLAVDFVF